jgi:hypothetical protein
MAYSSILGADTAPTQPSGRDAESLGPSDNSDSGSDTIGTDEAHADSDAVGTGERGSVGGADAREGADILPDRVVQIENDEQAPVDDAMNGLPEADPDAPQFTDLDPNEADRAQDEAD